MEMVKAFKYCPKCGSAATYNNKGAIVCTDCEYHFYINPAPTVSVMVESDAGEIMLVKRAVKPHKGTWDVPGGFVDLGETAEEAAVRELKEELGVEISVREIFSTDFSNDYEFGGVVRPILNISVRAKIVSGTPKPADDVSDFEYINKEKLLDKNIKLQGALEAIKQYQKKFSLSTIE